MGIFMLHDPIIKKLIIHHNMMHVVGRVNTTIIGIILSLLGAVLMNHLVEKPIYDYFMSELQVTKKETKENDSKNE